MYARQMSGAADETDKTSASSYTQPRCHCANAQHGATWIDLVNERSNLSDTQRDIPAPADDSPTIDEFFMLCHTPRTTSQTDGQTLVRQCVDIICVTGGWTSRYYLTYLS